MRVLSCCGVMTPPTIATTAIAHIGALASQLASTCDEPGRRDGRARDVARPTLAVS